MPKSETLSADSLSEISVPLEDLASLCSLAQAHLISPDLTRSVLLALHLEKEIGKPISDACLLRYDIKKSEEVFRGAYDPSVSVFHSAAEKVACHYGFGWKSKEADRALLLATPNPEQSPEQTFINTCCCAWDLQQLLENPPEVKERLFGPSYSGNEFEELAELLTSIPSERKSQLALKLGITKLSQATFTNHLAEIKAVKEEEAQSIIELERILNLPGSFLIRNHQTEELLKQMGLGPDDQLICLDKSENLYLVRFDRIPGEKYELPGYRLVKDPDFDAAQLPIFNENVGKITSKSSHEHLEGSFQGVAEDRERKRPSVQAIGLPKFIERLKTWLIQTSMVLAFANPIIPKELEAAVEGVIQKLPDRESITPEDKAMMAVAFYVGREVRKRLKAQGNVLVSPFNVAQPCEDDFLTSLNEENLPDRTRKALARLGIKQLPKNLTPLTFKKYLTALKEGLQEDLQIVISLRRDDIERDILTYSDVAKTDAFIQELKELKKAGIIIGVDISGVESALSVEEMREFIEKLQENELLCSIHAGEMPPEYTAQGLQNILDAIELGVPRIGHAFSLWYLLAAEENNQILADQREEIAKIAKRLNLDENASYQEIAKKIMKKAIEKDIVFPVCLASSLYACLTCDSRGNKIDEKISLYEKLKLHPLIEVLDDFRDLNFPKIELCSDDCVATEYSLEEEVQMLINILVERGYRLTRIHQLIEKYFMGSLK